MQVSATKYNPKVFASLGEVIILKSTSDPSALSEANCHALVLQLQTEYSKRGHIECNIASRLPFPHKIRINFPVTKTSVPD